MKPYEFKIIRLYSSGEFYTKASQAPAIPLGKSRIGGPVIDIPPNFTIPSDLYFVGLLDLNWISQIDPLNLLPKKGFLLFFYNQIIKQAVECVKVTPKWLVHYYEGDADSLKRITIEHEDWFFRGATLEKREVEIESMLERFNDDFGEDDRDRFNVYAGSDRTKIYGLYTNPQCYLDETIEMMTRNNIILLQVGEDITDEGIMTFYINKNDLKKGDFSHCQTVWGIS